MKLVLMLVLLFPSMIAAAQEACPHTEYAELKDMKADELQGKYCELTRYQESKKAEADRLASTGSMISFQYLKYSFQCESEAKRVAEVMDRSFGSTPAPCSPPEETSAPEASSQDSSGRPGE